MITIPRMADPWRFRMRRAVESSSRGRLRTSDPRPHYVVCGHDALVFHVLNGLLEAEVEGSPIRVTLLMLPGRQADAAQLRRLQGVRVIRADRLDEATFRNAGLVGARGLALLDQDDVGNIHAALCAQEVEPSLRVVMRMFNTSLASGVRRLFPDLAMLSDASMAAPAFVAAALGEVAPTHFRHDSRTLYVARRADVRPEDVVCGLADTRDNQIKVLPPADAETDLVLAEATGQPAGTELLGVERAKEMGRDRQLEHAVAEEGEPLVALRTPDRPRGVAEHRTTRGLRQRVEQLPQLARRGVVVRPSHLGPDGQVAQDAVDRLADRRDLGGFLVGQLHAVAVVELLHQREEVERVAFQVVLEARALGDRRGIDVQLLGQVLPNDVENLVTRHRRKR